MKNLLAIFLMAFVFVSCEGPMGPPGEKGEGIYWFVSDPIKITSNQWEEGTTSEGIPFYFYEVAVPELDNDIYNGGKVTGRIFLDFNTDIEALAPLEHTLQRQNQAGEKWNEIYSFEYYPKSVLFTVKFGDFHAGQRPPTQYFQIVLNY